jgi:hypothetical protein
MWIASYQGGMDLSLAWASRKRERKSREFVEDSLSEEISAALLRSAIRASPNPTMGFMWTDFRRWKMGFFAHSPSTHGICEIYRFFSIQVSEQSEG